MERQNNITLGELVGVGVSLVVIGLIFTFGTDILSDVRDDYTPTCPNATNSGGGDTFTWNAVNQTCINGTETSNTTGLWNATDQYLASNSSMGGMAEIPKKLPTIALIIAVSVIIAVLTRAFLKMRA